MKRHHGIVLITAPMCSACDIAKLSLYANGIQFETEDFNSIVGKTLQARNKITGAPVVVKFVHGQAVNMVEGWHNGYVKTIKSWVGAA